MCVSECAYSVVSQGRLGGEVARDTGIRHQSSAGTYCSRKDLASSTISDHGLGIVTIICSGNAASSQAGVQKYW